MPFCVETNQLTHQFSAGEKVLDQINLQVPRGSIYGFLGPNGAGKTTTLRLIMGLLKKQEGSITVFGKSFDKHRIAILQKTGSLIESPSLYGQLTAMENLLVLQKIYRCPKERLYELLKQVGLPNTGKKKTSQFSLGMKQRLGIALSLLNNPDLLIMDEPTNGLDPNGIIEIRALIKQLNEQGMTILLSSHLLTEMEKLVTHAGIIHRGKMLFQGTFEELIGKRQQSSLFVLDTSDPAKTMQLVRREGLAATMENGRIQLPTVPKAVIARINRQLVEQGIEVYELASVRNDLETIFIDLIKN